MNAGKTVFAQLMDFIPAHGQLSGTSGLPGGAKRANLQVIAPTNNGQRTTDN